MLFSEMNGRRFNDPLHCSPIEEEHNFINVDWYGIQTSIEKNVLLLTGNITGLAYLESAELTYFRMRNISYVSGTPEPMIPEKSSFVWSWCGVCKSVFKKFLFYRDSKCM